MITVGQLEVSGVQSNGKRDRVAAGKDRGCEPLGLPLGDADLYPVGVGVEVLLYVNQAAERGTGRRPIRQPIAHGPRPAQYDRYEDSPRSLREGTNVGWVIRVVEMPEVIVEKRVCSYGARARGWADQYLKHGGLADLIRRQRITRDQLVILDKESLGTRRG
jgi:hypothetical protein